TGPRHHHEEPPPRRFARPAGHHTTPGASPAPSPRPAEFSPPEEPRPGPSPSPVQAWPIPEPGPTLRACEESPPEARGRARASRRPVRREGRPYSRSDLAPHGSPRRSQPAEAQADFLHTL